MRLDLVLPNEGDYMVEAMNSGPHFEAMGWDGLWLSDHLLGTAEDTLHHQRWIEILIGMANLAAQTKRIRIGSGVLVLPYRDPVVTAKMIASIDHLSGGRVDLGVGVGWVKAEYVAVGRGDVYDQRGAFTNEVLDVMLACWKGGSIEFRGKWFDFGGVIFDPPPLQGDRVPLWIGSQRLTSGPMRRAAKYADYWHPSERAGVAQVQMTPEKFREGGELLDTMAGRKIARSLRIRCDGDPAPIVDLLHGFKEAGCVQAACSFYRSSPTFAEFDRAAARFHDAAHSLRTS